MPRDVRYHCYRHGPFLVSWRVAPGNKSPRRYWCPQCKWFAPRVHRSYVGGRSISIRGDTFARLKTESERRGVPMRQLIDEYTRDIK